MVDFINDLTTSQILRLVEIWGLAFVVFLVSFFVTKPFLLRHGFPSSIQNRKQSLLLALNLLPTVIFVFIFPYLINHSILSEPSKVLLKLEGPIVAFGLYKRDVLRVLELFGSVVAALAIILGVIRPLINEALKHIPAPQQNAVPTTQLLPISSWMYRGLLVLGAPLIAVTLIYFMEGGNNEILPSDPERSQTNGTNNIFIGLYKYELLGLSKVLINLIIGSLIQSFVIRSCLTRLLGVAGRNLTNQQSWAISFLTITVFCFGIIYLNHEFLSVMIRKISF